MLGTQKIHAEKENVASSHCIAQPYFSVPNFAPFRSLPHAEFCHLVTREMQEEGYHLVPHLRQPNSISTVERPPNSPPSSFFQTEQKPKPPFSPLDWVGRVSASH